MRVVAALVFIVVTATGAAAGPLGEFYPGLWANSPLACAAAKKGNADVTTSVATLSFRQLSWEEAVCKIGPVRKSGAGYARALSCNGGNGSLFWRGKMQIINSKMIKFTGGNLTQGTFRFCK